MTFKVEQKIIDWLLEDNTPPIKYLTKVKVLGLNDSDSNVVSTKNQIMSYPPILEILGNQKEDTYWFDARKDKNYKKYLGTFWQLIFLSELQAQRNRQIENAIEHIFSTGQAPNGGFSMTGTNSGTITCLTSNILRSLIHFGYLNDKRTENALEFLLSDFVDKEGYIRCQTMGLLARCYMTLPKILFALSAIPVQERTPRIRKGINLCVKRLLDNQIHMFIPEKNKEWLKYASENRFKGKQLTEEKEKFLKRYSPMNKIAKVGWLKFGFPLSYNSDTLDAMRALITADVEYSSEMDLALELIINKNKNGKWIKEKQFKSPMYSEIEPYDGESKWLTLHALMVLKHFKGITIL